MTSAGLLIISIRKVIKLNNVNALVVSDSFSVTKSVHLILRSMEVREARIHIASNGRSALQRASGTDYDIVIAGDRVDEHWKAKSLFEELTHSNLLRKDAVFIVWAATDRADVIRDVLDSEMDEVVSSSWTADEIRQKIGSLIRCKKALSQLHLSDADDVSLLSLCNQLEFTYPNYFYAVQKFRGQLFEKSADYDAAIRLYQSMLKHMNDGSEADWLYLRLSNVLIEHGQPEEARKVLQQYRLRCERYSVAALDIEAKLELSQGRVAKATSIISDACELMPDNYTRQELLGSLYLILEEYEKSQQVYQLCYHAGKHTFRDSPSTYFRYLRGLLYVAESDDALSYMYRKKFELEIKRWKGGTVLCKKEKLQFNLLKMHNKSLSGEQELVIAKLRQLYPELRQMNMDSLQHYLFLTGNFQLDKEMKEAYLVASSLDKEAIKDEFLQVEAYLLRNMYQRFRKSPEHEAETDYLPVSV
jgi:tetratricopeptide (TPR) repeat protein